MSLLNQLFNRGVFGAKCKTSLTLAISRIKLLQNKRDLQLKFMRKEIAQFLLAGQEAIARIRVEHIIREQNIRAAYDILELFCEFIHARTPIIESQKFSVKYLSNLVSIHKNMSRGRPDIDLYLPLIIADVNVGAILLGKTLEECPNDLREAIASVIFAAPRCSDVPDLLQIKNLFTTKYGKEFVAAAAELRPESGVNRELIEKLSISAPSAELKLKVLKDIAQEHNVDWDSSSTEAELSKKHEDLLAGSRQICNGVESPQAPNADVSIKSSSNGNHQTLVKNDARHLYHEASVPPTNSLSSVSNEIEASSKKSDASPVADSKMEARPQSSEILERARAAIASAERASAAARAAAQLVNVQYGTTKLQGGAS